MFSGAENVHSVLPVSKDEWTSEALALNSRTYSITNAAIIRMKVGTNGPLVPSNAILQANGVAQGLLGVISTGFIPIDSAIVGDCIIALTRWSHVNS